MGNEKRMQVLLQSINDVKEFTNIINNFKCDAALESGRYVVDAKSIMGIFSLDISKPIALVFEVGDNGVDDRDEAISAIKRFIVE